MRECVAGADSGRAHLLEGRVVEGVSRFCFRSRGRVSGPIFSVQAQDVAGLLEHGLQSDVSERLARRGSLGCDTNPGPGDE
jgi:hypothetical protein